MSGKQLLRGGTVVTGDTSLGVIVGGDVLVEGGVIAAVGIGLEAADAEVIDANGFLVTPGLVDTHKHTWQSAIRHLATNIDLDSYFGVYFAGYGSRFTPEDVYLGNLLGALTAIDSGTTTLMDWSHIQNSPAHSDRAIDALEDSGIRAVFGHGWPLTDLGAWLFDSQLTHPVDIRRIRTERLSDDHARVTLAFAGRGPELSTIETSRADIEQARELGIRSSIHMGCGRERAALEGIARLDAAGLLGPDLTFVHCSHSSDDEFRAMAANGVSAAISPYQELSMGHVGFTPIDRLRALGIDYGFSSDTESSGPGDLFSQMRVGLAAARVFANDGYSRFAGEPSDLTTDEIFEVATAGGAAVLGLQDRIGSLTPGKAADLLMIRATDPNLFPVTEPVAAIVASAHTGNVDSVMIAGEFRKRHGALVGTTVDSIRDRILESHDRLLGG